MDLALPLINLLTATYIGALPTALICVKGSTPLTYDSPAEVTTVAKCSPGYRRYIRVWDLLEMRNRIANGDPDLKREWAEGFINRNSNK